MSTEPYEARHLPEVPTGQDPTYDQAVGDLVTAVNGFIYAGERIDALMYALRYLRAHPEKAQFLLEWSPSEQG